MSALMKKHLTKVLIGNQEFSIPRKDAEAIMSLIKTIEKSLEKNISAEVVFKEVAKDRPKGAVYLRGIRTRENISQRELSTQTGIAVSNISKLESGARKITEANAKKLAKALDVDYKKFLL